MWSNCVLCWWEERERDEYRLGTECRMSAKGFVLKEVWERIEFAIFHTKTHKKQAKKRAETPAPKRACLESALGDTLLGFCLQLSLSFSFISNCLPFFPYILPSI